MDSTWDERSRLIIEAVNSKPKNSPRRHLEAQWNVLFFLGTGRAESNHGHKDSQTGLASLKTYCQ